jgi:hypothetical protein
MALDLDKRALCFDCAIEAWVSFNAMQCTRSARAQDRSKPRETPQDPNQRKA